MKLVSNNISPLPFYDDISQQNHRKDYAFGQVYPLITYKNTLLPFQVNVAVDEQGVLPAEDAKITAFDSNELTAYIYSRYIIYNSPFIRSGKLLSLNIHTYSHALADRQLTFYIGALDKNNRLVNYRAYSYSYAELGISTVTDKQTLDLSNKNVTFNAGEVICIYSRRPTDAGTDGKAFLVAKTSIPSDKILLSVSLGGPTTQDCELTYFTMDVAYNEFDPAEKYRIQDAKLINANDGTATDITESLINNGLHVKSSSIFMVLKYPGRLPVPEIKHEGLYYLCITISGVGTIYSDIFTVTNNISDYLLLEYGNSYNFFLKNGVVDFSDNFRFICYLNTQIGKPEYVFEEEATERMGYSFIESQVSKKLYKFTFLAPEYLCDALRLIRLCEYKRIVSRKQLYDLTAFTMEPEWQDQGDLAAVECEFETDTVIANIGGYAPELKGGDFNDDFNDDFNIK